jgi:hypothetical protein
MKAEKVVYRDEEGEWTPVSDWLALAALLVLSGTAACVFIFLRCLWRHWRG